MEVGGAAEGMNGGQLDYGSRSGSYTTARGGTVDYGAAGYGARGPGGGVAGRGVYGVRARRRAAGPTRTSAAPAARSDPVGTPWAAGRNRRRLRADAGRPSGVRGPASRPVRTASWPAVRGGCRRRSWRGPGACTRRDRAAVWRSAQEEPSPDGPTAPPPTGPTALTPTGGITRDGSTATGTATTTPPGDGTTTTGEEAGAAGAWVGMGMGLGMGLGWGLSSWGFGSALYGMGYMPYANPYYGYGGATAMAMPYDYSQPIDTVSAPADEAVTNPAMALFDAGRASFKEGNYTNALQQTNDALAKLPNDTTLHEFRALCLFALGRYDEAAATLYAVLSVGPGWDWTTLIGLYPSVDVYTTQLRALEEYCTIHPIRPPAGLSWLTTT